MALLFMDSFDHYTTADVVEKWSSLTNGTGITATIATGGRHSSNSFRLVLATAGTQAGASIQKALVSADATCVIGLAFQISNAAMAGTVGAPLLSIREGLSAQVTLRLNSNGTLSVMRGTANGTVLATSSGSIASGIPAYLELKVKIDPALGTVELHMNGATAFAPLTNQNTRITANSAWNGIALGSAEVNTNSWVNGSSGSLDYDDLYVLDGAGAAPWNTFLGDVRVDASSPTGPGTTTQWSPSAGANWQCVDEKPPNDDTDFVESMTSGAIDTFVVPDAPVGAIIFGVQQCIALKKTDAGSGSAAPIIRHSNVHYPGATLSPSTTYGYGLQINQVNPGTSAQWTEADFNAAEFGYKRI